MNEAYTPLLPSFINAASLYGETLSIPRGPCVRRPIELFFLFGLSLQGQLGRAPNYKHSLFCSPPFPVATASTAHKSPWRLSFFLLRPPVSRGHQPPRPGIVPNFSFCLLNQTFFSQDVLPAPVGRIFLSPNFSPTQIRRASFLRRQIK